jgi:aromatic-L-amino-acid/L-tryptophan decarboxylase
MSAPDPVPHMSPQQFRELGRQVIDWIADYLETVGDRPVRSAASPGDILASLPAEPPARGEDWSRILGDLDRVIMPGITHWQSPGFFAYFPANGSFPAILGDLVSTGLGVNGMLWATSPALTELEIRVMDWLGAMIGLPREFLSGSRGAAPGSAGAMQGGGVIQGTASEATLVALVAARHRALRDLAARGQASGDAASRLVIYTSTQAHSSVVKAAMIAGFAADAADRARVRLVETDAAFAMDAHRLADAMALDESRGLIPCFVCATVGTTSSTAVDPLADIGPICVRTGGPRAWLHVDAAMAGAACVCPEHRALLRGVEHADSVAFNPHKWLLTNFDLGAMWTRDRAAVIDGLAITPEYLRNTASGAGSVTDFRDWQIPLGRRFRALKLWFVIRHYGVEGLQAYIREHMRLALIFEQLLAADARFEIVAPRTITLVCFRLRARPGEPASQTSDRNRRLLEAINATGRAYLSHTVLPLGGHDAYVLRMAIGGARTEERHVRDAWRLIADLAGTV